ncbi:MAG TPA: GYD domain-containing protein, partial [Euzebya sp.]|nr:GYD domain-containing protein [Euzebya sp.]
ANYVGDGIRGLQREGGSKRRDAITELIESLGGTLESVYYAFGPTDIFLIVDLPDHASAAAASLVTNASGAVTASITVLLTAEDMDAAAQKTPLYRAPGS